MPRAREEIQVYALILHPQAQRRRAQAFDPYPSIAYVKSLDFMWRRAEFIKCPLQFRVNLWVFGIKMTVYTYRIAWYRSFFNFSLVLNKFNEILLHQKYIQIIDKNCWKMACLQHCFYWIFSIKPHLIFFPSCSSRNKLFKTVLTCQKSPSFEGVMPS